MARGDVIYEPKVDGNHNSSSHDLGLLHCVLAIWKLRITGLVNGMIWSSFIKCLLYVQLCI